MVDPPKNLIDVYPFYDTPDGEECLEKTYHFTKYTTIGGAIFSVYEMALVSRPPTIPAAIARFGRFTLPFAAMGFVFGSSLCILGQARKKYPVSNNLIAGALAGSVWGFKYNRAYPGVIMALFTGGTAAIAKYVIENDLPRLAYRGPEYRQNTPRLNFSIKMYDDPGRPDTP